jgi:tetratricopeptide (TPR) repeat protein
MKTLSASRRILFTVIAIALPFLFLGLLELVLRVAGYGNEYPLFTEDPQRADLLRVNPEIAGRYFLNSGAAPDVSFPSFRKKKNDKTIRVVVQGASTALGIPYMHGGAFPAMLEQRLRLSCPGKEVEVINTAITAVNSYTLLDLADEISAIEPDGVIIYAGHNEYYGALGVASTQLLTKAEVIKYLYMVLDDLRLFYLLQNIQKNIARKRSGDALLSPDKTLMERMVARQSIPYDSELFWAGIRQFNRNLKKLIGIYQDHNIPVLIGTTVCNLKDQAPFISEGTDPDADTLLKDENILELAATETMNARIHYLAGKIYLSNNEPDEARKMFLRARELDQLRFRAPEEINHIISKLSEDYGIILVDLDSVFAVNSRDGITGNELITEHVHPNARGYFLMADAFYNALRDHRIVSCGKAVSFQEAYEMMPVTHVDTVYARLGINLLTSSWPFTNERADKEAVLTSFSPVSLPDSLGWQVFNDQISWVEAINQLYRYSINIGMYKEALRAAESMKLEYRYSGIPYNMSARAYGLMSLADRAIQELEVGYMNEPLPEIAYNLSGYYLNTGNLSESARYLEYAISGSTAFDQAKERLQFLKSSIEMKEKLSIDSTNVSLMLSLAKNYIRLNQTSQANKLIRKAIITDPSHLEVRQILSGMKNQRQE